MASEQIREAHLRDVPALSALLIEVHDRHAAALPHIFAPIDASAQTAAFLRGPRLCGPVRRARGMSLRHAPGAYVSAVEPMDAALVGTDGETSAPIVESLARNDAQVVGTDAATRI